jgi:heme A synthase
MTFRFLVVIQVVAGGINIALLAPTWMQLVHLLLADLVWLTLVLYAASVLAAEPRAVNQPLPAPRVMEPATD